MSSPVPLRPRLAAHVLARRHLVDGELRVVLHDLDEARLVQIGPREWEFLAAADGTRDLEGIRLAAAREGAHARPAALEQFFSQLHLAAMLEDGAEPSGFDGASIHDPRPNPRAPAEPSSDGTASEPAPAEPLASPSRDDGDPAASRALEGLPGFTLSCDGSGSCCRLYASVVFGPLEATRARALLPGVLGGGERHERVFMPEHGSSPTGGAAVALRDGRCAYLADSGRCGLHEVAGPAAKPIGCATFPASFTDDGEVVRVSVSVECACVLASVGREGGSPLVPPGAAVRADLQETLTIHAVPDPVQVSPDRMAPRAELRAWSRRVAARLGQPADMAASLVSLGAAIAAGGLAADPAPSFARPAPIAPAALLPWLDALQRRASRREREDTDWRSERDLARRATRWIAAAAGALCDPDTLAALLAAPIAAPAAEAFYVRAAVHGHQMVTGALPLSLALHDRAIRILVARTLPAVFAALPAGDLDPACAHPLALVEAMLRGHGLDAYAHDMARLAST